MITVYTTLMQMLDETLRPLGVSSIFGEENINAQQEPTPMAVVVPVGGAYVEPGYVKDLNVNVEMLWATPENIELWLWSFNQHEDAPAAHADATLELTRCVLESFQNQLARGLYFKPISGRWQHMQNASIRYGRAYVLTVQTEIPITTSLPVEATVEEVTLNPLTFTT